MNYDQARRWQAKHPTGTRQPVLMSTGSGFWPSHAFLAGDFWPYLEACKAAGVEPLCVEAYYRARLRGGPLGDADTDAALRYTRARRCRTDAGADAPADSLRP